MRAFKSYTVEWLMNQRDDVTLLFMSDAVINFYYEDVYFTSLTCSNHPKKAKHIRIDLEEEYKPSDKHVEYMCRYWGKERYLGAFKHFYPNIFKSGFDHFKHVLKKVKKVFIK